MRRHFLRAGTAAALSISLMLSACGGGSDSNKQATLRLVNATSDVPAMNLLMGSSSKLSSLDLDAMSSSFSFDAGTYDTDLTSGSSTVELLSGNRSYTESTHYTAVAWGTASALKMALLSDTSDASDAPDSGEAVVRVFNAATDAGTLDIYLSSASADLDSVSPTVSGLTAGSLTSYASIAPGTYRLRVTGNGDKSDIRLDKSDVVIGNQARTSFVLQPGTSGVLVHALQFGYQSTLTALKNTQARVRLVAGVEGNGAVTASVGGTALNLGLRSPSVGGYVRVTAGSTQALSVAVAGVAQADRAQTLVAGADYTVMVSGLAAAPLTTVLTDDNRLPSSSTRTKLRLVHGAYGQDALSLAVDYNALATGVAYGSGSTFSTVTANSEAIVEVSSPLVAAPLYSTASSTVNLQAQGVYSVFVLGGGTAPTGVLRKDR
jgi:Domain of unknown function (DUF4397)